MSDKYTISDESIQDIFSNERRYVIPPYQRNYSWEKDKMNRLWGDIIEDNDNMEYLLGALVVIDKRNEPFEIVDGQQRLATLTLMLCAIRDYIHKNTKKDSPGKTTVLNKITNCILSDSGLRLVLSVSDRRCLEEIQKDTKTVKDIRNIEKEIKVGRKFSKSQKQLLKNYEECCKKLDKLLEKKEIDLENNLDDGIEKLRELLDNVLRKNSFALIKVSDENYAFKIFEALNTTGQKLTEADMIKNYIMYKTSAEDQDNIKRRWENIMKFDKPDYFLYESLLSRNPNKKIQTKNLYKIIKSRLNSKEDIEEYLKELEQDSKCFWYMENPYSGVPDNEYDDKIEMTFAGFNALGARYFIPAVLAAYREWDVKDSDFEKLCKCLLVFFFRFRTIQDDSIDTVRDIALKTIDAVLKKKSLQDILKNILFDSKNRLSSPDDKFIEKFEEYAKDGFPQKIAKYALRSIEDGCSQNTDVRPEYENLTLEHILPRNSKNWNANEFLSGSSENLDYFKSRLGNLTLVLQPWNTKMSNKTFNEKKPYYVKSNLCINKFVANCTSWTAESVIGREEELCKSATEVWSIEPFLQIIKS